MPSPWYLAVCLALATCAHRQEPPTERGALDRLFDLPQEHRNHALATHVAQAHPRLLVEVIPHASFEAQLDRLLPIGLDDFEILHVLVELDDPNLSLHPALALVAEDRQDITTLPLYAPTRDLFVAFTRERPARSHTRYGLTSARLPWWVNLPTVGILELVTLEVTRKEIPPNETDQIKATPPSPRRTAALATHLAIATTWSPAHATICRCASTSSSSCATRPAYASLGAPRSPPASHSPPDCTTGSTVSPSRWCRSTSNLC